MSSDLRIVAGLLALERGRAVPFASHLQVAIQPHAVLCCPLAMAGEDATIHAIAIGRLGHPPQVYSAPDPRFRDHQFALFRKLGAWLARYHAFCRERETYPQIWVSSGAGAALLDALADRLRFNRQDAEVRRFGTHLAYATERHPVAGQQALVVATDALRAHFATGQTEREDNHLGGLMTWLTPPEGVPVQTAAEAARRQPMGVKTDPTFDRIDLAPEVTAWNRARRASDAAGMARAAEQIHAALEPVAMDIYRGLEGAIEQLRGLEVLPLPALEALEEREYFHFASFTRHIEGGGFLPLRDSARRAAFGLVQREDAAENVEAALILGDRVARAQARLSGDVFQGRVENPRERRVRGRREHTLELVSAQTICRARRRDTLTWCDDPRLRFEVLDVRREGDRTRLFVGIRAGASAPGPPGAGAALELVSSTPNWHFVGRQMRKLSERTASRPWTHDPSAAPTTTPARDAPLDPLADVESLR